MASLRLNILEDLLSHLERNSNNRTKNETFFDKFFLRGVYADYNNYPIGNFNLSVSEFNKQKSCLASITNNQKINFFAKLLRRNIISADYYPTQIQHYERLKIWSKDSIFKQLSGDPVEKINKIEELPLPPLLKRFLEEDLTLIETHKNSLSP